MIELINVTKKYVGASVLKKVNLKIDESGQKRSRKNHTFKINWRLSKYHGGKNFCGRKNCFHCGNGHGSKLY